MDEKKRMEIITKAIDEASKIFGVDPAYFGEEGDREVDRQIEKLGYNPEESYKKN